jgi:hypoxanthine phosphoribosyltransferase
MPFTVKHGQFSKSSLERSPSKIERRLSWDETFNICERLVREILPIRNRLHTIVAIANGGIIPASMLAYKLQLDLKIVHRPPLDFRQSGVLLMDDVFDTGATIRAYMEETRWQWGATLGVIVKPWCPFRPTYIGLETEEWIKFSWEEF